MEEEFPTLTQFEKAFRPLSFFQVILKKKFSIEEDVLDLLYKEIKRMNKFQNEIEVSELRFYVGPYVYAFVQDLKKQKRYWNVFANLIYAFVDFPNKCGMSWCFANPAAIRLAINDSAKLSYEEIAMGVILLVLLSLSTRYDIQISLKIK